MSPSDKERAAGWHRVGDVLWTSRIRKPRVLPCAGYDEWYVFEAERELPELQVFVNYLGFQLEDPTRILEADPTWDRASFDVLVELQRAFWVQMKTCKPLSYLADDDYLNVVTQDVVLHRRVVEWCKRSSQ